MQRESERRNKLGSVQSEMHKREQGRGGETLRMYEETAMKEEMREALVNERNND